MSAVLRPALPSDVPRLLSIEQRAFPSDRIKPRQMRYLLTRARARSWVAEVDGVVAAYAMVLTPALPRAARLYSIAVDPLYRGAGLARRLLDQCLRDSRDAGYRRVILEVRAADTPVRDFYTRAGFELTGELPGYYADGADGVRMQWQPA